MTNEDRPLTAHLVFTIRDTVTNKR